MNIFLLHGVTFPHGMAGSAHAELFVKGLRKNGIKAFLIIPETNLIGNVANVKRMKGHFNGVPYFYMSNHATRSLNPLKKIFETYQGMTNAALLIFRRWLRRKLDVVIIGTPDLLRYFPIVFICYVLKIPIFIWAVEKMSLNVDFTGYRGRLSFFGYKLAENYLAHFANGYIVISTFLKKYYSNNIKDSKIMISPILVNSNSDCKPSSAGTFLKLRKKYNDKRIILYAGSFGEKDGVHYLLDAFAKVVKKFPDAHFILTGKSSKECIMNSVKKHISQMGLSKKIELVGFVSKTELLYYTFLARLLLVCRSNSKFANYGFPWKLGEYCMTGKPILATRVGDIGKYFTDSRDIFLCEPENPEAIAERVIFIFKHYNEALEVAKRGKYIAKKYFGYEKCTKEIIDFIKKV